MQLTGQEQRIYSLYESDRKISDIVAELKEENVSQRSFYKTLKQIEAKGKKVEWRSKTGKSQVRERDERGRFIKVSQLEQKIETLNKIEKKDNQNKKTSNIISQGIGYLAVASATLGILLTPTKTSDSEIKYDNNYEIANTQSIAQTSNLMKTAIASLENIADKTKETIRTIKDTTAYAMQFSNLMNNATNTTTKLIKLAEHTQTQVEAYALNIANQIKVNQSNTTTIQRPYTELTSIPLEEEKLEVVSLGLLPEKQSPNSIIESFGLEFRVEPSNSAEMLQEENWAIPVIAIDQTNEYQLTNRMRAMIERWPHTTTLTYTQLMSLPKDDPRFIPTFTNSPRENIERLSVINNLEDITSRPQRFPFATTADPILVSELIDEPPSEDGIYYKDGWDRPGMVALVDKKGFTALYHGSAETFTPSIQHLNLTLSDSAKKTKTYKPNTLFALLRSDQKDRD